MRRSSRRPMMQIARIAFMVALLLVPLALRGHGHGQRHAAGSCAVCVAVHHTPSLAAPAISLGAGLVVAALPDAPPVTVAPSSPRSPHAGRAPPFAASARAV